MEYRDPISGLPAPSAPPIPHQRGWVPYVVMSAFVLVIAGVAFWAHNTMLGRAETVDAAWAQVESTMQRRADLVPRLVEVVKRAMSHESRVLNDVAQQRTNPMSEVAHALEQLTRAKTESQAKLDALGGDAPVDADGLARVLRRSNEIARGVQVVLAVAEDYPTLRSSDQLLELQAQLEGSENRINVARMVFNDAVQSYNAALVQLPTNLFAGGMEKRAYFKASEEAHVAKALGL